MKRIDVDEFAAHPARYLQGRHSVEVSQDGHAIGYYLPILSAHDKEFRDSMAQLKETVARVLEETGMTEDELADLFDLNRPFPYAAVSEEQAVHAPGR